MTANRWISALTMSALLVSACAPKSRLKLGQTAEGEVVEAEGVVTLQKNDLPATESAALAAAERSAVEKVVGVYVSGKTVVEKAALIESRILARTEGYISKYDLISKGPDGEFKEESTFVEVEAWGRTAELIGQYLTKGSPCYLEGRLRFESWQEKDGAKRSKIKVIAENVQFLGKPRGAGGSEPAEGEATSERKTAAAGARSIPAGEAIDQPPF